MPDLFDSLNKPAAASRPGTSQGAANRLPMFVLNRLRRRIYEYIVACEPRGATCDEIEIALKLMHQTCSARVNELENVQKKFFDGIQFIFMTQRERKTRSGTPAGVYRPIWAQELEEQKDWLRTPKSDSPQEKV